MKRCLNLIFLTLFFQCFCSGAYAEVKSLILCIGDGMGIGQVTAAQITAAGPDGRLSMTEKTRVGLVATHSLTGLVTDSAAGGTALSCGRKTLNKMIAMSPQGEKYVTILEACRNQGKATGLVTTTSITHATPACFGAHIKDRHEEENIAEQLLENRINVLLGGGQAFFLPRDLKGKRRDDRDLLKEAEKSGYRVTKTKKGMKKLKGDYVLGVFSEYGMTGEEAEPSIREMTEKAIEILSRNTNGFFLMVEGGNIDQRCHENNQREAVMETIYFDEAVQSCLQYARENPGTLVIITADHETGGMAVVGDLRGEIPEIGWVTDCHTGSLVPLFAYGQGSENFSRVMDNTDVPRICARILNLKDFPEGTDERP